MFTNNDPGRRFDNFSEENARRWLDAYTKRQTIILDKKKSGPITNNEEHLLQLYTFYMHRLRMRLAELARNPDVDFICRDELRR